VYCEREGVVTASQVTDHVIPHRADQGLFWDRGNWAASCRACNTRKAATAERSFKDLAAFVAAAFPDRPRLVALALRAGGAV
jgi:5-methylcytosine-specific restriction endonuclease McrA